MLEDRNEVTITGKWDAAIATPIGTQSVVFDIRIDAANMLSGTATDKHATVEMEDLYLVGQRLTWTQHVARPLRLELRFEVDVDRDSMQGIAKAGVLPASRVTANRLQ
jgi:hypothetical protein